MAQGTLGDSELASFFFGILLLLTSAHLFGHVFHRFRMPRVIGEIAGGVLLGPTVLGAVWPQVHASAFNAFEFHGELLSAIYWFGLVLLMFISGFEIQGSISRSDAGIISVILVGATLLPFAGGWLVPYFYDFTPYLGEKGNMLALQIVLGIAVSVTSIPVISRIFLDLKITNTRFAKVVLATATIQDVILWVALAIATGLVSTAAPSSLEILSVVLVTLLFFAAALAIVPRLMRAAATHRLNFLAGSNPAAYLLFICFLFVVIASSLGVNIVFGAFLAGIVVGFFPENQNTAVKAHIREVSLAFFVPIYFAIVGLKLDLIHGLDLGFLIFFLVFSTVLEVLGTIVAAKLVRLDWLSSLNLGVAMNTRGGPGIILASITFELGIINETFFVTLVLAAILTSLLAGYWFQLVRSKGWALLATSERNPTLEHG